MLIRHWLGKRGWGCMRGGNDKGATGWRWIGRQEFSLQEIFWEMDLERVHMCVSL